LITPFLHLTKSDILRTGMRLGVPYEHTWSCYQNEDEACGRCGACHFRKAAFAEIGMQDPIRYGQE
jgi:7-cyano-7-deazaguanine synthase